MVEIEFSVLVVTGIASVAEYSVPTA